MKDAKGHGSNNRGALPGAAAHQSMVRKVLASGDVHQAMAHALTRYDREQSHKASQGRGYYNQYALPQYLGAAERIMTDIKAGKPHADAINAHTSGAVANRLHKALGTNVKFPKNDYSAADAAANRLRAK
jgi:hypothetical protein